VFGGRQREAGCAVVKIISLKMSNSFYLASSLVVAYLSDWDVSLWPATFPALRLIYD